jgi:hypothetical protein
MDDARDGQENESLSDRKHFGRFASWFLLKEALKDLVVQLILDREPRGCSPG